MREDLNVMTRPILLNALERTLSTNRKYMIATVNFAADAPKGCIQDQRKKIMMVAAAFSPVVT